MVYETFQKGPSLNIYVKLHFTEGLSTGDGCNVLYRKKLILKNNAKETSVAIVEMIFFLKLLKFAERKSKQGLSK